MRAQLIPEQVSWFEEIIKAVEQYDCHSHGNHSTGFFLKGAARTGKTFVYNCLCSDLWAEGKIVCCVGLSGIPAQLLLGGQTAHSWFKIPLSNAFHSGCNITSSSPLTHLIRNTSLISWDEVPMQHESCLEAVNWTLNDNCHINNSSLFGIIPIVLDGNFGQILPVIRRGSQQATVQVCIQHSSIWHSLHRLRLRTTMRIEANNCNRIFISFLKSLVNDSTMYGKIAIPDCIHRVTSVDHLSDQRYRQASLFLLLL